MIILPNMESSIYKKRIASKILVGGQFTSYNGTTQNRITRLNFDGTIDTSFSIGTGFDNGVLATAIQSDGKIIVGGQFTSYNGTTQNRITRLNSDGPIDASFNIGTGFNVNAARAIAIQSDGKIIVGGNFTSYNGTTQNRITRLNSDGSIDASFNTGVGFNAAVRAIAIQSDGKIVVGGIFTSYNATTPRRSIIRLNSDGTIDTSFSIGAGFNSAVFTVAVESNGKIVVGGQFTSYGNEVVPTNGITQNCIARLNSDGTLDGTDFGGGFDIAVAAIAIQSDGKIVVGGPFTTYKGATQNRIARLKPADGTLDSTEFVLNGGFNSDPYTIRIQSDGKILVGGNFTAYSGTTQNYITRLNSNGDRDTEFTIGTGFNSSYVFAISIS